VAPFFRLAHETKNRTGLFGCLFAWRLRSAVTSATGAPTSDSAIDALSLDLTDIKRSSIIETRPQGVGDEHGPYLNAAIVGVTTLAARDLLDRLLEIEEDQGRQRPYPAAPRTLDLDLILYGDSVIEEEGLIVPHPRFRERAFVLKPLAEIAPDMRDPITHHTISDLLVRPPVISGPVFRRLPPEVRFCLGVWLALSALVGAVASVPAFSRPGTVCRRHHPSLPSSSSGGPGCLPSWRSYSPFCFSRSAGRFR
jgi:2-amino-4-hydroxy-6-hydroxymethyldihydropteridine diphosphokinase